MRLYGKELNDAKVDASRESFERNMASYGKAGKLTFDELLEKLAMDCNSLASIGEEHGVSREWMRQIYNRYFRDLFPGSKSGRRRTRICTLKRSKIVEQDFSIGDTEPWVQAIVIAARGNGLSVRRAKTGNKKLTRYASMSAFKKYELLINGKRCSLHLSKSRWRAGKKAGRYYSRLGFKYLKDSPYDFHIVWQDIEEPRIFVIPRESLPEKSWGSRVYLYIPIERSSPYARVGNRIAWFQYEDAWHLIQA